MARTKKPNLKPVAHDPKKVKHGCCSCVYKDEDVKKFPCSECETEKGFWYYWTDTNPEETGAPKPVEKPEAPPKKGRSSKSVEQNKNSTPAKQAAEPVTPRKRGRPKKET